MITAHKIEGFLVFVTAILGDMRKEKDFSVSRYRGDWQENSPLILHGKGRMAKVWPCGNYKVTPERRGTLLHVHYDLARTCGKLFCGVMDDCSMEHLKKAYKELERQSEEHRAYCRKQVDDLGNFSDTTND